ncbi:SAM-dependent methyltransferase [Saccharopolyspora erythraea]|uniref:SAM-dependent methyltransferase n=1 Tax=Saccharopolyspora erythraea TaxID=1836 RepID=UPI0032C24241
MISSSTAAEAGHDNREGLMPEQNSFPTEVDHTRPNPARIYDYGLGGHHNFAADRDQFEKLLEVDPDARLVVSANRAFLRRAVRYCLRQGITQFLDLGSGIPTVGNVHEAAHQLNPRARVVYVDNEPIAVAHTRRLLRENDNAEIVQADLRDPEAILRAPETQRLLDLSKPVGLMMVAVLHWVPSADVAGLLSRYREVLAPGSYLAISHLTSEHLPEQMGEVEDVFAETTEPVVYRPRSEAAKLFEGFELVPPGVVYTSQWQSEPYEMVEPPERTKIWAAVGRKL